MKDAFIKTTFFLFLLVPLWFPVSSYAYRADILWYLGPGHQQETSYERGGLNELGCEITGSCSGLRYEIANEAQFVIDGKLLYPDGQPRYRMVLMGGGKSTYYYYGCTTYPDPNYPLICGPGLGDAGRQNMISYVNSGGNYQGICAGSLFASRESSYQPPGVYLGVWPGKTMSHSSSLNLSYALSTDPINSGFGTKITNVYFRGGPDFVNGDSFTDYVATYTAPYSKTNKQSEFEGKNALLVYDKGVADPKGRLVLSGSHPEKNNREYFKRLVTYTLGKNALFSATALTSGVAHVPQYRVGDRQFHYFYIDTPAGVSDLTVQLADGIQGGGNVDLYVQKDDYPTLTGFLAKSAGTGASESVHIPDATEGRWFIGVYGGHDNWQGEDYTLTATYAGSNQSPTVTPVTATSTPGVTTVAGSPTPTRTPTPVPTNIPTPTAGAGVTVTPIVSGLVGYWPMNEGSGTSVGDASGRGITGTITNGAAWTAGKKGGALSFDGTDDVVVFSGAPELNTMGSMTLSAWVYPRTTGENGLGRILDKATSTAPVNGWTFNIGTNNGWNLSVDYSTTNLSRKTAPGLLVLNTWQHVVVTWDGSSGSSHIHIYVNGVESGSYNGAQSGVGTRVSDTASVLRMGNSVNGDRTFNGVLDEVKVFNRVLSAAEVANLALQ